MIQWDAETVQLARKHAETLAEALARNPARGYKPNNIQEQFHRATHTVRLLVPGNGLGKTTAVWFEASMWIQHYSPYREVPKEPVEIILFVQEYGQFEKMKMTLEKRLPHGFHWNDQKHFYTWPDGSRLYIESCEKSWKVSQGTNPHLVIFDEVPPFEIWNEMRMRKRGDRETEYAFAATATDGEDWMVPLFWDPWVDAHKAKGFGVDEAQTAQVHPDYWIWHAGGIDDNAHTSQKQKDWFHAQKFASDEERKVRLRGGFARFNRRPVFDREAIVLLETKMDGWDAERGVGKRMGMSLVKDNRSVASVLDLQPHELKGQRFVLDESPIADGRMEVYEPPAPGGVYVIGGDCAKGMEKGDFDSLDIFLKPSPRDPLGPTPRHVAKLLGHWGERLDRLLYAAAMLYNGAFLLLERQEGLAIMRRLWDDYGYTYIYYQRDPAQPNRKVRDALGHARVHDDFTIRNLQVALRNGELAIRSKDTLEQMRKLEWYKPGEQVNITDRPSDRELKMRLPGGGSPDQVMSLAYSWLALDEVFHYDKPEDLFPKGSLGDIFGYGKVFAKDQPNTSLPTVGGAPVYTRKR